MGLFRQEYWNELPLASPGDLLDPGIKPWSSALSADDLTLRQIGSGRTGEGKSEHRYSRNQRSKMDWNWSI